MARGPSKLEWYERVPRKKEQVNSFNELQYLEVLRKAAARQFPEEELKLSDIAKTLGMPTKKLKQFMRVPSGFTKDMAVTYAETIRVPPKVLNKVGNSLFKESEPASPRTKPPGEQRAKPSTTNWKEITERAEESDKNRKNPHGKGQIDLDKVKKITLVNYMEETMYMVCHLEKDGTLRMSLIPNMADDANLHPYTGDIIKGERVVLIQAVKHSKRSLHLTEAHVPVRKVRSR